MRVRRKRGDVLARVISTIGNAAIAISRHPARNSASVYRTIRDFRELQDLSDQQIRNMSRYIINKRYITIHKGSGGSSIEVSEKGKAAVAGNVRRTLMPKRPIVWDSKWRIVMFDVPNHLKKSRDGFAGLLKSFEFEHMQKSVFVSPYPCEEEIEAAADYYNISDCVDMIVAERISREGEFKRLFKLK